MIRPKENPNFVSHREAEQTLLAAATGNRCPHAWLITGPKGVGKATLAHRFARFLLAHPAGETPAPGLFGDALPASAPQTLALDVDDPVFRRAVAGGHTDLKILDEDAVTGRSGQIPVEAVRSVAPFLRQTAGEGGRRVVVIDALDAINQAGANALLKILEEPPDNAVLILVAHSMGRVLPTIRSRCRLLRLSPLSADAVGEVLSSEAEQHDVAELDAAVHLCGGSPGRAIALLADDGLQIFQAVDAFWQAGGKVGVDAISALSALAGQDANRFRHFRDAFCLALVAQARSKGGGPQWDEMWSETLHLCDRTEAVFLDRRQVAMNRLTAAAKLV